MALPTILQDIKLCLEKCCIQISDAVEGEGRGGSLKDEGSVKRALLGDERFRHHIIDEKARKFGDMVVLDYDMQTRHVVNIKTSIGSTDNCFSKAGMVYAFTDIDDCNIPSAMNFKKMNELIETHGKDVPNRDYWFLCIDKNDSSQVIIRGAKQIQNWVINSNPSNILQVNWKKEKMCEPVVRTWQEAYDEIFGKAKTALQRFFDNLPHDWIQTSEIAVLKARIAELEAQR